MLPAAARGVSGQGPQPRAAPGQQVLETFHTCPIAEGARLGRTLRRWRGQFLGYFTTDRASNGGTEAINGIIELHRRIARGYRNRHNYRLRMLLVGGGLLLPTGTPMSQFPGARQGTSCSSGPTTSRGVDILASLDQPTNRVVLIGGADITTVHDKEISSGSGASHQFCVPRLQPPPMPTARKRAADADDRGPQIPPHRLDQVIRAMGIEDRLSHRS